ncbi:MAG: anaerobic ribonucleoside-triphosphate reductase activating protein [Promethearchaeota archaeon Loki_b32]|nr:MAG: anaerobic ribonucleoside-triphosphate reductase activating protein [Candidatus Lokiarchaeota archaeon Loki_b32]
MRIGGIIDISTKDIPHRSSMVIFTVGCNFKCKFCHNKYLLQLNVGREYRISELMDKIKSNLLVSGVSITGGEPTLQDDLPELCREIHKINKYLSVDTNGSNPDVIKNIAPFINRVALDLKSPLKPKKMENITGIKINLDKISETIKYLRNQKDIDFEIRTTFVEELLDADDIGEIINYLRNIEFDGNFVLQQYQYREGVGERFKDVFLKPEHDVLHNLLKPFKGLELPFKIFLRDEIVGYCSIDEL